MRFDEPEDFSLTDGVTQAEAELDSDPLNLEAYRDYVRDSAEPLEGFAELDEDEQAMYWWLRTKGPY
jgi:hypothetical protein